MLCFRLPDQYGAGKHWSFPGDGESAPGSLVGSVRCRRIWSFAARTRIAPITARKSVAWPAELVFREVPGKSVQRSRQPSPAFVAGAQPSSRCIELSPVAVIERQKPAKSL